MDPLINFYRRYRLLYLSSYVRQVIVSIWHGTYYLRLVFGAIIILISTGIFDNLSPASTLLITIMAIIVIIMAIMPIKIPLFKRQIIEQELFARSNMLYNPWLILRDTPIINNSTAWQSHQEWAKNILQRAKFRPFKYHLPHVSRLDWIFIAVLTMMIAMWNGSIEKITNNLSRNDGVTNIPAFQASITAPQVYGITSKIIDDNTSLQMLPAGSIVDFTFDKYGNITPYLALDNIKYRLNTNDFKKWSSVINTGGVAELHFGFLHKPLGNFNIKVDEAPIIKLLSPPTVSNDAKIQMTLQANDDFGINNIDASISIINANDVSPDFRNSEQYKVLELSSPPYQQIISEQKKTIDTGRSYFAGKQVSFIILARDVVGNLSQSVKYNITLSPPQFNNPVARGLYDIRSALISGADFPSQAKKLPIILSQLPAPKPALFLGLKSITVLINNGDDSHRRTIVDLLWDIINDVETRPSLDGLQQTSDLLNQLQQSIDNPEKVAELIQKIQSSMQQYFKGLEQVMKQQGLIPDNANLNTDALNSFLQKLQDAAKYGNTDQVKQMIEQFSQMLKNLPQQAGDIKAMKELQNAIQDLNELSKQQSELLQEKDPKISADKQQKILDKLSSIKQKLDHFGLPTQSLSEAENSMKSAVNALKYDPQSAKSFMRTALEKLNQGISGAMQALEEQGRITPTGTGNQNTSDIEINDDTASAKLREILKTIRQKINTEDNPTKEYLQNLLKGE